MPDIGSAMLRYRFDTKLLIALCGFFPYASIVASSELPDEVRFSREGVMYRVDMHDSLAVQNQYRIVESDPDPEAGHEIEEAKAHLAIADSMTIREALNLLLKDSGMAVRFTGERSLASANRSVGPMVISGSLLGAIRNLAKQSGVQAIVHRDAIEFADSKSFVLFMPSYENPTEMASRLANAKTTNLKVVGKSIQFDATVDALRNVQGVIREVRAGRRGISAFMAKESARHETLASQKNSTTKLRSNKGANAVDAHNERARAEASLLAQMGLQNRVKPTPNAPLQERISETNGNAAPVKATTPDPFATALVTLDYAGEALDGLAKLAKEHGLSHGVIGNPKAIPIKIKLTNVPLDLALESFSAQLKKQASLEYNRPARQVYLVYP